MPKYCPNCHAKSLYFVSNSEPNYFNYSECVECQYVKYIRDCDTSEEMLHQFTIEKIQAILAGDKFETTFLFDCSKKKELSIIEISLLNYLAIKYFKLSLHQLRLAIVQYVSTIEQMESINTPVKYVYIHSKRKHQNYI
jgi:hypothetical protein